MDASPEHRLFERIYGLVARIPAGQVATYGDIAAILGTRDARAVGYALNVLPRARADVPWQRIVNREGGISTSGPEQRALLEAEGILFDARGRVPLSRYRWAGPGSEARQDDGSEQLPLF